MDGCYKCRIIQNKFSTDKMMGHLSSMMMFLLFLLLIQEQILQLRVTAEKEGFVTRSGVNFVLNGTRFYRNGFNAYWLMYEASKTETRYVITSAFEEAVEHSLGIARAWAFGESGYYSLQNSPGSYNEAMFKGLDFVVSEAKNNGIKLILSLVNNYEALGGKAQYVAWANTFGGQNIASPDDFFTNAVVKEYYKNHIKTVLTRINTITGTAYKDEPTIMAWELMNEPRCVSDLSGKTLQNWIEEMASYLKNIDPNHLLEVGLEGFYGESDAYRQQNNKNFQVGTDFLSNNNVTEVDFATVHSYPDTWLKSESDENQLSFLETWLANHIKDAQNVLKKPILLAEFGKSSNVSGYNTSQRDAVFNKVYSAILSSAKEGGAAAGGMFWQLLTRETLNFHDGYEVILSESSSTANLIKTQSQNLNEIPK